MPGRFPFRSSSPSNPQFIPHSVSNEPPVLPPTKYVRKRNLMVKWKRRIRSRLKTVKEIFHELRRSRTFKTVGSIYVAVALLYQIALWLIPETGQAVERLPKIRYLLTGKSWIIFGLLILLGFVIDGAFRVKRRKLKQQAKRHREVSERHLKESAASRDTISALSGEVEELKQRLNATNLVVSYDKGRYDHKEMDGEKLLSRTVRLQIENKSDRDINDIRVKAESFSNSGTVVNQIPLRIQHDETNQKKYGFSLSPGEKEMVDVVERRINSALTLLCPAINGDFVTPQDQFPIAVIITAKEQPKQRKLLRVSKHDTELLHCVPLKG